MTEAKMASPPKMNRRPTVAVTGMGILTSLGIGKEENWTKLVHGCSGVRRISRFPNEGLKTTIAGTVDFVPVEPFCSTELAERMAAVRLKLNEARRHLAEAAKDRKILEKLRERQEEAWRADLRRREAAETDEIASQMTYRKMSRAEDR